ncbi:segregation/condensation protein A [Clostridium sp.]|jgi:segregation and condensation protein A|uniref:segregation/condensation protein A n=1 Tax=Clostridium sp. TaxID=1506 RepID=UPI003A5BC587
MSLNIKIENFEGPFDLLLHLVKKNKMDIYDVKIHEITNQYIEYISRMNEMDLELTSEFIVMASTLLEIKSKTLLPKSVSENNDEDEDPRTELVNKLLEYRKFKKAAEFLRKREKEIGISFSKKPEIIVMKKDNSKSDDILKNVTILRLYNIYSKLMKLYMDKLNIENEFIKDIPMDRFKVEDKMQYIKESVKTGQTIRFSNILNKCKFKIEKVVTFVALLELAKRGIVTIAQRFAFDEIYVEGTVKFGQ